MVDRKNIADSCKTADSLVSVSISNIYSKEKAANFF